MSVNNTEFGDDGSYYARDLPHVSEAIDRLAAYEDTGLTPEKLAEFLKKVECRPPWDDAFVKAFCYKCKTETVTVTDEPKRTLEVHPCDFTDGECPHGSDIAWWLAQRCADKKEVET